MAFIALLVGLSSCSLFGERPRYSVYFQPYSAALDGQAQDTVQHAASYAVAHPNRPVFVTGYAAPPDPGKDVDGLSVQRAGAVTKALTDAGVNANRIVTTGNGTIDPGAMPNVSVRRVDISFGT
ncbi:OmpA family protein [Rhodopila sp.]|uniref:OmpA family protein n=1 Tax=Rhodopila sp. TaxID=2480087 RepID=UPI002D7FE73C|nr:OmpA family protein [Rhodopila sp.]